jgi:capsular polysaccharide biosynthesis protein
VDALARAAVRWAAAWPWSRLRAEPAAFDVPWLDRTPALAAWMDDGMWARWLLSALPQVDDLRAAVHDLLCERLAAAVDEVVTASCGGSGPC